MDNLEVKLILDDIDEENFKIIVNWMYNWWGKEEGDSIEEVECFMKHSFLKDRLPQTYGLFLNNKIIGMYQFTYFDLSDRPDIYPWFATLYVDEEYRNKGYARYMLNTVKENAKKVIKNKEIFLYTKYTNFYEKFGWEFISQIDTYKEIPRVQNLYKLDLFDD